MDEGLNAKVQFSVQGKEEYLVTFEFNNTRKEVVVALEAGLIKLQQELLGRFGK